MKKYLLTFAMGLLLALALAPAAFAADVSNQEEFEAAITEGNTINLTTNITFTSTVEVDKSVTINGNDFEISAPNNANVLLITEGANNVVLNSLKINAAGSGFGIYARGPHLTVSECVINASNRGMTFYPVNGQNATLDVSNTNIYNTNVTDYDLAASYGDNRGISVSNVTSGEIDIDTCEIYGFGYSLNFVNDPDETGLRDGNGTIYNVNNSIVKGWSALNIWTANSDINLTNCTLVGINGLEGSWNGFSTIRANDGIYGGYTNKETVVTIKGGSVVSKQYSTALQTPFTVDRELQTEFVFQKNGRDKVNIEVYSINSEAYVFCFYPNVDGDSYLNSSKVEGYPENCTISSGSLLENNSLALNNIYVS